MLSWILEQPTKLPSILRRTRVLRYSETGRKEYELADEVTNTQVGGIKVKGDKVVNKQKVISRCRVGFQTPSVRLDVGCRTPVQTLAIQVLAATSHSKPLLEWRYKLIFRDGSY